MKYLMSVFLVLLISCEVIGQQNTFSVNCDKDFWTITSDGIIQNWCLENNEITGGDIIVSGGGVSLAFCGEEKSSTFYTDSWNNGEIGINYYDENSGWINIPTTHPVQDNGGHLEDHFCTVVGGVIQHVNYWDGSKLTVIDSLPGEFFAGVFDVAVDTAGHAWIFTGSTPGTAVDSLKVYNATGKINSYSFTFDIQAYGSFFLNDILYIGTQRDSIYPINIDSNNAELGSGIPFPPNNFTDMASCQNSDITNASTAISSNQVRIYPNPSLGLIEVSSPKIDFNVTTYNCNGQLINTKRLGNVLDLTNQPSGLYYLKVRIQDRSEIYKVIKL